MSTIGNVVKKLDQAVNNKNLEESLNYYEDEALLVMQPGRVAKGKSEIRDFFKYIFEMDITASQITANVMETGDIALFTSRWIAEGRTPDGNSYSNEKIATSVFRGSDDGKWRLVIDNSFGPKVLNQESA